jgi:hypothetical protein
MTVRSSILVLAAPLAAVFGCSDPPPTPPSGAAQVLLTPASSTIPNIGPRTVCNAGTSGTYTYFFGNAMKSLASEPGQDRVLKGLLQHGKGVNVSCTIKALGGARFSVSASVGGTDANSQRYPGSVRLNGTVTAGGPASGNIARVGFFSPEAQRLENIPGLPECTIGPVITGDDTDPLTGKVKEGALLADFSCPVVGVFDATNSGCDITASIALEHCLTGKEED